mmetsp:Transcript_11570/g.15556  ORF Transcript_11570/g.15556 Transcript_11570/m.15556 type:complete len:217 (-) Transcript_11570:432-1082(-)
MRLWQRLPQVVTARRRIRTECTWRSVIPLLRKGMQRRGNGGVEGTPISARRGTMRVRTKQTSSKKSSAWRESALRAGSRTQRLRLRAVGTNSLIPHGCRPVSGRSSRTLRPWCTGADGAILRRSTSQRSLILAIFSEAKSRQHGSSTTFYMLSKTASWPRQSWANHGTVGCKTGGSFSTAMCKQHGTIIIRPTLSGMGRWRKFPRLVKARCGGTAP